MRESSPGNPTAAAWTADLLCSRALEAALVQQPRTIKIIRSSHLGIKVSDYRCSRSLLQAVEYVWKGRMLWPLMHSGDGEIYWYVKIP